MGGVEAGRGNSRLWNDQGEKKCFVFTYLLIVPTYVSYLGTFIYLRAVTTSHTKKQKNEPQYYYGINHNHTPH